MFVDVLLKKKTELQTGHNSCGKADKHGSLPKKIKGKFFSSNSKFIINLHS